MFSLKILWISLSTFQLNGVLKTLKSRDASAEEAKTEERRVMTAGIVDEKTAAAVNLAKAAILEVINDMAAKFDSKLTGLEDKLVKLEAAVMSNEAI